MLCAIQITAIRAAYTVCLLAVSFAGAALADPAKFTAADAAAREGRLGDMQRIYESILSEQPDDIRALTGRAAALAWQKEYILAQQTYRRALSLEPENVDARVGLGYAYAWNGDYSAAHTEFNRALMTDPSHIGARKGVAYAYLWAGEVELALEAFDIAASIAPNEPEVWEAIGNARVEMRHNRDAIADFDRALLLDPGRESARVGRANAYRSAPIFEIAARAGSTSDAGSGLRFVEISHWPSRFSRLFARYDNSLGLDNASIADRGSDAPGYFAGASHQFPNRVTLEFEAGRRDLESGTQVVTAVRGSVATRPGVLQLGAQLGDHEDGPSDKLVHAGFGIPLRGDWRIEPVVYASESGVDDDTEWRGVINVERRLSHSLLVGGFIGAGNIDAAAPEFAGETRLAGGWLNYDFDGRFAVTFSARYEETPASDFTVAEIGFSYRMAGNRGASR